MIRYYIEPSDCRYLYKTKECKKEDRICINYSNSKYDKTYVNILETITSDLGPTYQCVRVYHSNGEVQEGWINVLTLNPFKLTNINELFDGRFNV